MLDRIPKHLQPFAVAPALLVLCLVSGLFGEYGGPVVVRVVGCFLAVFFGIGTFVAFGIGANETFERFERNGGDSIRAENEELRAALHEADLEGADSADVSGD